MRNFWESTIIKSDTTNVTIYIWVNTTHANIKFNRLCHDAKVYDKRLTGESHLTGESESSMVKRKQERNNASSNMSHITCTVHINQLS